MKKNAFLFMTVMTVALTAGCGGSDSSAPGPEQNATTAPAPAPAPVPAPTPAPTPAPAAPPSPTDATAKPASEAGVYIGPMGVYGNVTLIVLEDGSIRGLLYSPTVRIAWGYFEANGKFTDGSFVSTGAVAMLSNYGATSVASLSATLGQYARLAGSLSVPSRSESVPFDATRVYEINGVTSPRPPSLADIAGTWTTVARNGPTASVTVSADGQMTGTLYGCNFVGAAKPRSDGVILTDIVVSLFDVTVTYEVSANCDFPGKTQTGIGVFTSDYGQFFEFGVRSDDGSAAMTFGGVR